MSPPDGPPPSDLLSLPDGMAGRVDHTMSWSESGGILTQAPCYAAGTHIAAERGEVPVESLRAGDRVFAVHLPGTPLQPVTWIGHRRIRRLNRRANVAALAPVRIAAGALADGVPHRDLRVSPDHALFLDGRLVPAKLLVNGITIEQERHHPEITYWHVELPAHGLLLAEGAPSESYFDDGNRAQYDNRGLMTLVKTALTARSAGAYDAAACFLPLRHGQGLDRIRARLAARAEGLLVPA